VATQIPYAVFVAVCAGIGTLAASLAGFSWIVGLLVTAALFVGGASLLPTWFGAQKYKLED
jgi:Na+/H+ antiporter NhaC